MARFETAVAGAVALSGLAAVATTAFLGWRQTRVFQSMSPNQPSWLVFAPGIFLVMWSTGYVAAKFGLGYIEPMTFLALRFACVVAIMAALFVILRPPLPKSRSAWVHLAIVGSAASAVLRHVLYVLHPPGFRSAPWL